MNLIEYESNSGRNEILSVEEYLNKVRPVLKFLRFLKDIINNLKKSDTWKIQPTKAINFVSSTDNNEERVMHSKSDNIENMINDEANEVIKNLLIHSKKRNWNNLELMQGSNFVFDCACLSYYKYHKMNLNCGASNIDFPD